MDDPRPVAAFVFLCNLLYTLAGTVVAVRLLRLAQRTKGTPERLIGVGLLIFSLVCQPLLVVASGAFGELSLPAYQVVIGVAVAGSATTVTCLYRFSQLVFEPNEPWARGLVGVGAAVAVLAGVGIWLQPPLFSDEASNPFWMSLSSVNYAACFGWAGLESVRYFGKMRRRATLGLADPVVTNRFGIWGAMMLASAAITLVLAGLTVAGLRIGVDPAASLCVAASGLINALGWWLSFAPPEAYLRHVRARAARPAQA